MRASRRVLFLVLSIAVSTWPVGCGGGGNSVWVKGTLTKGGARYTPPEGQRLSITLIAIEAKDETGKVIKNEPYLARLEPDGESFTVPGKDGYGVPPGKYRVSIHQTMTREAFDAAKSSSRGGKTIERDADLLGDKFGPESSPIVREVDGSRPLKVDLDRPTEG